MYLCSMSKVALKIENFSSEELKSLLRKDEKFQQGIRLYACYQVSLGKRPKELEDIYETSFKSICNWVNKLNKGGLEALVDKEKPGRNSRLSIEQKDVLKDTILNKNPDNFGYNSSTWTGALVLDWIEKTYQINFKKAQIYNILKSLGLSFQKRRESIQSLKTEKKRLKH